MGKLIVNCKYDLGNGWSEQINWMVDFLKDLADNSDCNAELNVVERSGCDLIVKLNIVPIEEGHPIDGTLLFAMQGVTETVANVLRSICPKCGKDKGLPPSLTVRPGLCEKCRSKILPSDYKDNVIVCMSGKAGSGKDTIADYLVEKHGFVRTAFADPLRDIVQLVFVLDHDSVWDRKLRELPMKNLPNYTTNDTVKWYREEGIKDFPKLTIEEADLLLNQFGWTPTDLKSLEKDEFYWSVRKLLQFIGTEMFRNLINRDTWVMNFVQRIEPGVNYVVTDVRFPNEMDWVKTKFGGKVAFTEVVRPGCDGKGVGIENHESERYKLPADFVFQNDGTLEELYEKIENFIIGLKT